MVLIISKAITPWPCTKLIRFALKEAKILWYILILIQLMLLFRLILK